MTPHVLDAFSEPAIASRAALAVAGAAAVGALVLAVRALPQQATLRPMVLPVVQSGFAYLMLGLGSRFVIQHHRSRLQIVVLLGAVAVTEALRYRRGGAGLPRVASWLAGSMAVCLGVVAAKWALEPGALTDAFNHLRGADGAA